MFTYNIRRISKKLRMMHNKHMNYFLMFTLFVCAPAVSSAGNIFSTLPFNIVITKTTYEEIENRGICISKIKIKPEYFRCKAYEMSAGFEVIMSQNQLVSELLFNKDRYPRKWRDAGINKNITAQKFFFILEAMGIYDAHIQIGRGGGTLADREGGWDLGKAWAFKPRNFMEFSETEAASVSFVVDDYQYIVRFINPKLDHERMYTVTDYSYGVEHMTLKDMQVIESF